MMYVYAATIVRIIDADTVVVDWDLGRGIWVHDEHLRLTGINAPELSTPNGKVARVWLMAKLWPGLAVTIRTEKDRTEKYGRYLATVWDNDRGDVSGDSINDQLVTSGHAVPYSGGPR